MSLRTRTLLTLLGLCALAGGCGDVSFSFGGLDTEPLEQEIEIGIEARADGIDIDSVECPDDVQPEEGRVFVCRAHAVDGSIGTVEVQQVDDAGGVEWELTDVRAPAGSD
ncbi:DUF4333 domain-containing protein [Euzebya sp.]|uniref:DUF4333 domain-containing protein n=1 Tax=Euzebya sp. TaxID=1971409 RepID=UPI0035179285